MTRRRQRGISTVEFAIVAAAFFMILLGAIEISRLLFTWNTLDAIAQRAARLAAVCTANDPAIATIAAGFGASGASPLPGFTAANLQITYLDEGFAAASGGLSDTSFVRAQIVGYQIELAIPFINNTGLTSPTFTAVVPSESLGYIPETGGQSCA